MTATSAKTGSGFFRSLCSGHRILYSKAWFCIRRPVHPRRFLSPSCRLLSLRRAPRLPSLCAHYAPSVRPLCAHYSLATASRDVGLSGALPCCLQAVCWSSVWLCLCVLLRVCRCVCACRARASPLLRKRCPATPWNVASPYFPPSTRAHIVPCPGSCARWRWHRVPHPEHPGVDGKQRK